MKSSVLLFLCAWQIAVHGQQARMDSLHSILAERPKADIQRVHTLLALSDAAKSINYIEGREAAKEADRIAVALGDDSAHCAALAQETLLIYMSGDLDAYVPLNQAALTLAEQKGYRTLLARSIVLKHCIALYADSLPGYTTEMRKAIALLHSTNDRTQLAWALLQWAICAGNADSEGRADSLAHARALYERSGDRSGIAQCMMGGMFIRLFRGEHYANTIIQLDSAIALARLVGDRAVLIDAYTNAIAMHLNLGDHGKALEAGLAGIREAEAYGAATSISAVNSNTGYILLDLDEVERAIGYFRAAIAARGWLRYDLSARTGLAMC